MAAKSVYSRKISPKEAKEDFILTLKHFAFGALDTVKILKKIFNFFGS